MKRIILFFWLILGISYMGFTQSVLKIYTDLPDESAKFMLWLNGEKQDAVPMSEIEIDDLAAGKYEMRVVFNADTIADYVKVIKIQANKNITFKVVKKGEFGKESGKMGRAFGTKTGTTGENEKEGLVDWYRLEIIK